MTANAPTHEARLALTSALNVLWDEKQWSSKLFDLARSNGGSNLTRTQAKQLESHSLTAQAYSDVEMYLYRQISKDYEARNGTSIPCNDWRLALLTLFKDLKVVAEEEAGKVTAIAGTFDAARLCQEAVLFYYRKAAEHFAAYALYFDLKHKSEQEQNRKRNHGDSRRQNRPSSSSGRGGRR